MDKETKEKILEWLEENKTRIHDGIGLRSETDYVHKLVAFLNPPTEDESTCPDCGE